MNQAHDDGRGRAGRVYLGERTGDLPGDTAVAVEEGGYRWPLPHVVYHSPTGLSWGYHGSGPADTALLILADALGERPTPAQLRCGEPQCWRWHQHFKRDVIARFPQDRGFRLAPGQDMGGHLAGASLADAPAFRRKDGWRTQDSPSGSRIST